MIKHACHDKSVRRMVSIPKLSIYSEWLHHHRIVHVSKRNPPSFQCKCINQTLLSSLMWKLHQNMITLKSHSVYSTLWKAVFMYRLMLHDQQKGGVSEGGGDTHSSRRYNKASDAHAEIIQMPATRQSVLRTITIHQQLACKSCRSRKAAKPGWGQQ